MIHLVTSVTLLLAVVALFACYVLLRGAPCASTPSRPTLRIAEFGSDSPRQGRHGLARSVAVMVLLLSTSCDQRYSVPRAFRRSTWNCGHDANSSDFVGRQRIAGAGKLFGRTPSNGSGELSLASVGAAAQGKRPLIISSANGVHALDKGMDILKKGGDTLDAVVAAVTIVEDDPNDDSVGYGGLPNEEGEVELDASVMHGPTHRAGSVASVRRIKNVSRLAKTVMENKSRRDRGRWRDGCGAGRV